MQGMMDSFHQLVPDLQEPSVSLIVVTYNSADLLPDFFAALATTAYSHYEVLVVDNNSQDGTLRYLAEAQPHVTVLANEQNIGFGRACNQGAQAAQGELLVFMNPDVLVTASWLSTLAQHLCEHPDAAIICPTTVSKAQSIAAREPGTDNIRPSVEEVAAVPGCALMIRREAWRALGGFDEQMFLYWEDTDLCWRAWLHGWRVLTDHVAMVYHERGGSGGSLWDSERVKNGLYTYLKLMRWRRVLLFLLSEAAKTLAKAVFGRGHGLVEAWAWNLRHLGLTLAQRRELLRERRGNPVVLERLVREHTRRMHAGRRWGGSVRRTTVS